MEASLPFIGASLVLMFVGWVAKTSWPHLNRACLKWRGQRRCVRGHHSMRQIDRRVVHDGPDGPEEELLIACKWCGQKVTLDADDLWM